MNIVKTLQFVFLCAMLSVLRDKLFLLVWQLGANFSLILLYIVVVNCNVKKIFGLMF